jgi:cobalt-zinc-cadmium efflux system outer membrane protein
MWCVVFRLTVLTLVVLALPTAAIAQTPLTFADVLRVAGERRDEIVAAREAIRAGEQRPTIVSALDDPMVAMSLDHIPFMGGGVDFNGTVEQRWPLSNVRAHRRASAVADIGRLRAESERAVLDVQVQAASAFLMLHNRRRMAAVVDAQIAVAQQVVAAANARYASGAAPQSDVLRGELELARLQSVARGLQGEVRAAEAMLNASTAQPAGAPVPPLVAVTTRETPTLAAAIERALASRPELAGARATMARSEAEVLVMQTMSRPMLTVRTGPAYTMAEGAGWMAMAGVSIPLWRSKQRALVAEATAMRAMSEADLRALTRMIEGETAAAHGELDAAVARESSLSGDVIPRARMAVDSATTAYAAGRVPLVSVIESIQAQWSLELELVDAETAHGLARTRLGRAMGSYEGILQ